MQFFSSVQVAEHRMETEVRIISIEAADYWAGMSLEQTHEENDVEAAGEDSDPSPPTPHGQRGDPVGRLSGDMKEHQLQATVGAGKNHCRACAANKIRKDTRYVCKTCRFPCIKQIAS
jgi:hypothetical protein